MDLSVSVTLRDDDKTVFEKEISTQQMRDSNYQQEQLNTDNEPLPKLKEGELFYLAAAINKMKAEVNDYMSQRLASESTDNHEKSSKKVKIDEGSD